MRQQSDFTFTLADRMRKAITVAGLAQSDIARHLGVDPRTVTRWLNGHSRPSIGYLRAWAQVTEAPLDWLMVGDQDDQADVA